VFLAFRGLGKIVAGYMVNVERSICYTFVTTDMKRTESIPYGLLNRSNSALSPTISFSFRKPDKQVPCLQLHLNLLCFSP
jgi:hypothetical protein